MKICVLNFSGNVGKTTIAANLLLPRMPGAVLKSVETLNQDAEGEGVEAERIRAGRFHDIQTKVLEAESIIVDVGSSNVEMFLTLMAQYEGSADDFDYFIVPAIADGKPQADTINTILALHSLGVGPERVKVIFNRVQPVEDVREEFAPLFGMQAKGLVFLSERATIWNNEVFDRVKDAGRPLASFIADDKDFRRAVREAPPRSAEQAAAIAELAIKRLSASCARNLDAVFGELFAEA